MFFEGAERVGVRREGGVVDFYGAIGDGGDEDRVVRFGPSDVIDSVGGVEGDEFVDDWGARGQVDDVDTTVA